MAKVYIGDVGTILKVRTGYNFITDASASVELRVMRPGDTTEVTWIAAPSGVASEASNGIVLHYIDSTNLTTAGQYKVQALVGEGDSTNQWFGQPGAFTIYNRWS